MPKDPHLREAALDLGKKIKMHMDGLRKEDTERKRKDFENERKRSS